MAKTNDFSKYLKATVDLFRNSVKVITTVYREKGIKFFQLPLIIGLGGVFVLNIAVRKPLLTKIAMIKAQTVALEAQSQYASDYTGFKTTISSKVGNLPDFKDKDDWLNSIILAACQYVNVVPNSTSGVGEADAGEYLVSQMTFDVTVDYATLGKLCAFIENVPKFVRISNMTVNRAALGKLDVSITLNTMFAKGG